MSVFFFFSSRRRHTRWTGDWSSDVCSSDLSIGAITIDPTNPKTIWVGTGEAWTRNSVSIGDGIYKSTDGGETWANMGLRSEERRVGKECRSRWSAYE